MSKPGQPPLHIDPAAQMALLLSVYRDDVSPQALALFTARIASLGLAFTTDELIVLAALNTPERVQQFLDTQVYYNNDPVDPRV